MTLVDKNILFYVARRLRWATFFLFYFISQYINCEFFYLYLKLGMCIAVYISEKKKKGENIKQKT